MDSVLRLHPVDSGFGLRADARSQDHLQASTLCTHLGSNVLPHTFGVVLDQPPRMPDDFLRRTVIGAEDDGFRVGVGLGKIENQSAISPRQP
jgi:hypothetical protein